MSQYSYNYHLCKCNFSVFISKEWVYVEHRFCYTITIVDDKYTPDTYFHWQWGKANYLLSENIYMYIFDQMAAVQWDSCFCTVWDIKEAGHHSLNTQARCSSNGHLLFDKFSFTISLLSTLFFWNNEYAASTIGS